jgi:hypothetical protein
MILGMSISMFTTVHTIISLIAIVAGLIVLFGMLRGTNSAAWTGLFLVTTVLTSVTGFMFPRTAVTPAQIVGGLSLVVLVLAILALYLFHLKGAWRWIYVVTAISALYLNVFVLVVQSFQKLSFLHPLAPTQSEPPFLIAQTLVLVLFIVAGFLGIRRFHPTVQAMPHSPAV